MLVHVQSLQASSVHQDIKEASNLPECLTEQSATVAEEKEDQEGKFLGKTGIGRPIWMDEA